MRVWCLSVMLLGVVFASAYGHAQAQLAASGTSTSSAATVARTVQGRVVNALDGSPVPRVLVSLNARSVLTDVQGRFAFPEFTDQQAYVTLTKPGFSQTARSTMMGRQQQRVTNLDAPLELKIYPDAIIAGTVTSRDGLPLSQVQVQLRRAITGAQGTQAQMIAAAMTTTRGEYRFRQPPGRYQVLVDFVAKARETGETVLPETFPQASGGDALSFFDVSSGEEKHIDLRPRTGVGYPIEVKVDPADGQRGVIFTAMTSSNEVFQVGFAPQVAPGTYQVTLPPGGYLLRGRVMSRDAVLNGSARITITGRTNDPVVLHLEPLTSLPVEMAIDSASASTFSPPTSTSTGATSTGTRQSTAPPDLRQFNLRLVSLTDQNPGGQPEQVQLQQREDKTYEFRVGPGRYRLEANGGGRWYVESASYGVENLMSGDITIASGGTSSAIRLVVNDTKGTAQATVAIPANSPGIWVYWVPSGPSLTPVNPIQIFDNGTGSGTVTMSLPVGSYTAIAVDHPLEEDLRNPDVVAKFSTQAKQIDVAASATATVALEIAQEKETTSP